MIYLHKLGPLIFSPLALAIALVIFGALIGRKWICVTAACLLYVVSMPFASDYIVRAAEIYAVRQTPEAVSNADAIVVLSGFLYTVASSKGVYTEWGDPDRFFGGLELFKAGKAPLLIFTDGQVPWQPSAIPEGLVLRKFAESMGVPSQSVQVTGEVENTAQEAVAVRKLLPDPGASRLLVTSAFHMPRAEKLFQNAGFTVYSYPVDFKVEERSITLMDFVPKPAALMMSDTAIREQIGKAFYWLKFRISGN